MAGPGNILIRVGAETGQAVRELGNLKSPLSDVQTRSEKMGATMRRAALPAAAALAAMAAAGVSAAKAAAEDQQEQVKLAGTLERVAGATRAQVAAAESYIGALSRATGVTDSEMRPALARLATASGSVATAQKDLGLALDISAQTGKPLEAVSAALAKAYAGQTTSLGRLVPGLDAAVLKSKDMSAITGELANLTGGAAAQAADTAAGRYRIMQVQLGELQETIGAALLPVIQRLTGIMQGAIDAATRHSGVTKVLIGAVAALAAGVLIVNAAMSVYTAGAAVVRAATVAWTGVQWLLNAALTANPIGAIIVLVAALAAGVLIAYNRSETFRGAVQRVWAVLRDSAAARAAEAAFKAIATAVEAVIGVVQRLLSAIGSIRWPSPPSWLGKLPGVGGLFDARRPAGGAYPFGGARGAAAVRGARLRSASSGDVNITVSGALDPEAVARQIERLLAGHRRRQRMRFAT